MSKKLKTEIAAIAQNVGLAPRACHPHHVSYGLSRTAADGTVHDIVIFVNGDMNMGDIRVASHGGRHGYRQTMDGPVENSVYHFSTTTTKVDSAWVNELDRTLKSAMLVYANV